jgi:prephenate dehydrogenase
VRVAFLGFGLIGGSVARALRAAGPTAFGVDGAAPLVLTGWSPTGDGPAAAVRDGVLDTAATDPRSAVDGAQLVILAGPVPACLALLDDLAADPPPALAADAVITDVASTKVALALRATALGLPYVGGHPMAGSDQAGYAASSADLFVDRPWVVVPGRDATAVERVEALARAVGARPIRMSAAAHDQAVAGISHLPLVVAGALVEAVAGSATDPRRDWPEARSVAATGWRDMTRLARGDVAMGSGIVTTNAPAVAARLRDLVAVLETWASELERPGGPDPATVEARLSAARAILEASDR